VQQYTSFSCIWCIHLAIDKNNFTSHIKKYYFWHFCWLPYLYAFSLYENASLSSSLPRQNTFRQDLGLSRFAEFLPLIYPPELEVKETTATASFASFVDLYLELDDSGQLSTKIYDKRDDFNSDEDDVSGNHNNCYWPLHSESIARCIHHMQEKLVYCCTYLRCIFI
jgi:hypothetical protein